MKRKEKGFTLLEMLIVVAVVAVLAAVAIPAISKSVHRSQEMADVANVRAYYAFLQADYMSTGKCLPGISDEWLPSVTDTIVYPDGTTIKLKTGLVSVIYPSLNDPTATPGYMVAYQCKIDDCEYIFGAKGN